MPDAASLLTWKPGPPPRDVPALYLIAMPPDMGGHRIWLCEVLEGGMPWVHGPFSQQGRDDTFDAAHLHLGPLPDPDAIPDPPAGATE